MAMYGPHHADGALRAGPAKLPKDAVAITVSDSDPNIFQGIYVGGAGDVKVTTERGTDTVFKAVPVGKDLSIRVIKVWDTGTTATNLVGYSED
jgi:hypothetical protein